MYGAAVFEGKKRCARLSDALLALLDVQVPMLEGVPGPRKAFLLKALGHYFYVLLRSGYWLFAVESSYRAGIKSQNRF